MKMKCPHCAGEIEINPASLLGKGKKKSLSPKAILARQLNGKKGGRPKKSPVPVPVDISEEQ